MKRLSSNRTLSTSANTARFVSSSCQSIKDSTVFLSGLHCSSQSLQFPLLALKTSHSLPRYLLLNRSVKTKSRSTRPCSALRDLARCFSTTTQRRHPKLNANHHKSLPTTTTTSTPSTPTMSSTVAASKAYPHPMLPAMYREQRHRLGASLLAAFPDKSHAALLRAGSEVPINNSDVTYLFVQETYFNYLFGTELPDCLGLVLADGTGVLLIPRLPADFATWMGPLPTPETVKARTGVEECHYIDEMGAVLERHHIAVVEVLNGVNSDSGLPALTAQLPAANTSGAVKVGDSDWLFNTLGTQRAFKTRLEAEVLRYVCKASSEAHMQVMRTCKPGMSQNQLEATFLHHAYYHGGCRKVSYTCICATGHHGATLHYPDNDQPVEDGTMALLDMGGNYRGYAADITCSYPVNGKFTERQKIIYSAVLDAHDAVLNAMKPGLSWVDMHTLAIRTTCSHLLKAGIFQNATVEQLMEKEVMQYFQPHGLGHLIGLEVHDVGAYLPDTPPRPTKKDHCKLRTARVLEEGLYLSVEPGCYFNAALIEKALNDPNLEGFVNKEVLMSFADFGGVRIESDVLVTSDGIVNYTVVPRTIDEIEAVMAGKPFSKECEVFHNA